MGLKFIKDGARRLIFASFVKAGRIFAGKGIGSIPGVKRIYNLLYNIIMPREIALISVQGSKMYVNTRDCWIGPYLLVDGSYEKYETELFKKLIKPGQVVVDIGANIGYYTLIASRLAGEAGRVYAFEPGPESFKLLLKNIRINNCANIIPVLKAVADRSAKTKLYLHNIDYCTVSLAEDNIRPLKGYSIDTETVALDEFFVDTAKEQKIDVIKTDAEGAEGLIIAGAERVLRNNGLSILLEFWPFGLQHVGSDPLQLLDRLRGYGFKMQLIDETAQALRPIDMEKIREVCKDKNNEDSFNLLLLK